MNRPASNRPAAPAAGLVAVAAASLLLASCRSLAVPAAIHAAARIEALGREAEPERIAAGASTAPASAEAPIRDAAVRPAGCEAPCPPLPRLRRAGEGACRGCPSCSVGIHDRTCRVCPGGACAAGACGTDLCLPLEPPVPTVGPYLVCDGGDQFAPARPAGPSGIVNLTAGDTVARYRAASTDEAVAVRWSGLPATRYPLPNDSADGTPVAEEDSAADDRVQDETANDETANDDTATDAEGVAAAGPPAVTSPAVTSPAVPPPADDDAEVCIAVANCACVFSPRFASVREIIRPFEEAAPVGPSGLARDAVVAADIGRQPVWGSTQQLAPEAARRAEPGVAVEERLPPLAVDQNEIPGEADGAERPDERAAEEQPLLALRTQRPMLKVGFDVPVAWTCVKAANVLVADRTPAVVAADRGTATLRFEEPGRAELTLCKRAGSDTARIGEELDFTIYLLNSGDRPLSDIVLVDALPKRLELIPDAAASSLPADFSTGEGDDGSVVLTWRFAETLRPGESGFVRFRTIVR